MSKAQEPKIRPTMDIVRYHDILDEILNNPEVSNKINWIDGETAKQNMIVIKRTLCWVLQHDEGRWLSQNMDTVEKVLADIGFDLKRVQ